MTDAAEILVSAALSIHNRSDLFARALHGYAWQTMPADRWEIVLVDDMSTEDLRAAYGPWIGKMNLLHVRINHQRHPVWLERNLGWHTGEPEDWYHTPAITTNVGIALSRGRVLCLCHPEILHAPANFERASLRLGDQNEKSFLFGTTWLGKPTSTPALRMSTRIWTERGWEGFLRWIRPEIERKFQPNELYWYTSFLPRAAAAHVRGVDFGFLNGVAGEDDDFKYRVHNAGWCAVHAPEIEGFHQDHTHEQEAHRNRTTERWQEALEENRTLLRRKSKEGYSPLANVDCDWAALATIESATRFSVGSVVPEEIDPRTLGIVPLDNHAITSYPLRR